MPILNCFIKSTISMFQCNVRNSLLLPDINVIYFLYIAVCNNVIMLIRFYSLWKISLDRNLTTLLNDRDPEAIFVSQACDKDYLMHSISSVWLQDVIERKINRSIDNIVDIRGTVLPSLRPSSQSSHSRYGSQHFPWLAQRGVRQSDESCLYTEHVHDIWSTHEFQGTFVKFPINALSLLANALSYEYPIEWICKGALWLGLATYQGFI